MRRGLSGSRKNGRGLRRHQGRLCGALLGIVFLIPLSAAAQEYAEIIDLTVPRSDPVTNQRVIEFIQALRFETTLPPEERVPPLEVRLESVAIASSGTGLIAEAEIRNAGTETFYYPLAIGWDALYDPDDDDNRHEVMLRLRLRLRSLSSSEEAFVGAASTSRSSIEPDQALALLPGESVLVRFPVSLSRLASEWFDRLRTGDLLAAGAVRLIRYRDGSPFGGEGFTRYYSDPVMSDDVPVPSDR